MGAADQVPGGHALQHHRRGLLVADAVRQWHEPVGRHDPRITVGAERSAGVGDTVAWFQIVDPGPDLLDDPGRLGTEAARQWHRVKPAALIGVDVVEADRGMSQPNLSLAGLADLNLLPLQNLGPAGFREPNCVSHLPLLSG